MLKKIKTFNPIIININQASDLIWKSDKCARDERVCRVINEDSKFSESVFLDKLAEGMINAGKAKPVEKEVAINTLKNYPEIH